jgi:hypothetical protein
MVPASVTYAEFTEYQLADQTDSGDATAPVTA